jgi:hypothetical protein
LDQAEVSQATRYLFDGVVFSGEGDAKVDQEIVEFKEDGGRMQGWCGATYSRGQKYLRALPTGNDRPRVHFLYFHSLFLLYSNVVAL